MPPHNQPTNVTPLFRFSEQPKDYPVGVRFVANDTPGLWTTDELLWSCFFSGLAGALITVGLAFVWSFFL